MGTLLPWGIFRGLYLNLPIAANGRHFPLGNPRLGQIEHEPVVLSDATFAIYRFLRLVRLEYPENVYRRGTFPKAPAGLASIRRELHYARPLAIVQAIQLSSLCTTFHPSTPAFVKLKRPVYSGMLHSPSGFPFRISREMIGCNLSSFRASLSRLFDDYLILFPTACSMAVF